VDGPISEAGSAGVVGRRLPRPQFARLARRKGQGDFGDYPSHDTQGRHALVHTDDGPNDGRQQRVGFPDLGRARIAAASRGKFQALERQAFCRETDGRCRRLPESARQGRGVVRGREVAGSGAGPDAAGIAHEERPLRNNDARLQTLRDHLPVRGVECAGRPGHRLLLSETPERGIPEVPAADRWRRACGIGHPYDPGQLRHAQPPQGQGLVGKTSAFPSSFHTDQLVLAELGRKMVRRDYAKTDSSRGLPKRTRTHHGHRRFHQGEQRKPQTVRLDEKGRCHLEEDRAL